MLLRAPAPTLYDDLLADDVVYDALDKGDRDEYEKSSNKKASTMKRKRIAYLQKLRHLRQRLAVANMADATRNVTSEAGRKGPMQTPTDTWTETLLRGRFPPGCHLRIDNHAHRFQAKLLSGSISRAW